MLKDARNKGIVKHMSTLWDTYFEGGRDHRLERCSATQIPYLEGDYWPGERRGRGRGRCGGCSGGGAVTQQARRWVGPEEVAAARRARDAWDVVQGSDGCVRVGALVAALSG